MGESVKKRGRRNILCPGEKSGWLTIERFSHKDRYSYYIARCVCGTDITLRLGDFKYTTSCGCKRGGRHIKPNHQAQKNSLYTNYRVRAKSKNILFEITKTHFEKLLASDCYYCGSGVSNTYKSSPAVEDFYYNGVDRIDSSKGYTEDNIVPCCGRCNQAKNTMSVEEFLEWIKKVYEHNF